MLNSDAIWASPDALCAPENAAAFLRLKLAKAVRTRGGTYQEADRNRPLVIPGFALKSSRDLAGISG
jgi:hypothetical protein